MKMMITAVVCIGFLGTAHLSAQEIVDLSSRKDAVELKPQKAKYPVPEKYRGKELFEITYPEFNSLREMKTYGLELAEDSDSSVGKAMAIRKPCVQEDADSYHTKEFVMGIQGRVSKKTLSFVRLKNNQVPQDEKYHFHLLGRFNLEPNTLFWGHATWHLQQNLGKWYDHKNPSRNRVEVLVSLKLTGPAYVPNSKKENGIYIDRFLLVPSN